LFISIHELTYCFYQEKKMKLFPRISIGAALALGFLLVTTATVLACGPGGGPGPSDWGDPTVSSGTGVVVSPDKLPGTQATQSGMVLPAGYGTNGQFGGSGITVNGAPSSNNTKLCFAFPTYRYGWEGTITKWNGSRWVTVKNDLVAPSGDSSSYQVCTNSAGNGTYSLIINYTGHD
jgi:hypothetical protein